MIDHLIIKVSNIEKSKAFYIKALQPLGYRLGEVYEGWGCGFECEGKRVFWIGTPKVGEKIGQSHIAFAAKTRALVDDFYNAAMKAGGKDKGAPGLREKYHENYYGGFVFDPDGNNIEAVCHKPE
ncbi:MAG: VOC family protein [SAR324 cluster bacterium]|nr:VOC family protein [SAR324 cluster bacterium]